MTIRPPPAAPNVIRTYQHPEYSPPNTAPVNGLRPLRLVCIPLLVSLTNHLILSRSLLIQLHLNHPQHLLINLFFLPIYIDHLVSTRIKLVSLCWTNSRLFL